MAKFSSAAKKCLDRIKSGRPAGLSAGDRAGMVAELKEAGVRVSAARADAWVASRYDAEHRADEWSDAAREAAAEARRANAKAAETNKAEDHKAAAAASNKAAEAHRQAGAEAQAKGDWKAVSEHAGAALAHSQNAQISAEKAGAAPSTMKVTMSSTPVVPRTSPLAGKNQIAPGPSPADKLTPGMRAAGAKEYAKASSKEANKMTKAMAGGGTPEQHDKAAALHETAKNAWLGAERAQRSMGNEHEADLAHSRAEQHAVKGSDHAYSAGALRAAKK